ncbi:MAG: NnrS family protein [Alphaproteobacteria bacterium]|nr:NnrS family protein [Alphaproteobacteria bacterium]MDE2630457.1 NnrS family protein [Alphaproteobacteria bacterium]
MAAIPRYRQVTGPTLFSAGFRPFFLAAALWAALAVPIWLVAYATGIVLPSALPPVIWHAHEMIFGFAAATVAGFLLTAIPNWTGRMPLQGWPLAVLVSLWLIGRFAILFSAEIGAPVAALADLSFPVVFIAAVAREILMGRNWRNLPMLAALSLLLIGNLLVHLDALGLADTAALGNRMGIGTLLTLIALVGGRIVPSFTRNWLARNRPDVAVSAQAGTFDLVALVVTGLGLAAWIFAPDSLVAPWAELAAGVAAGMRLSRWRGLRTTREPLVLILHIGYGWLAIGLMLLGINGLYEFLPQTTALHALTVGTVGTMTLAVMTRASLGHTGRTLSAGPVTKVIYLLVTLAAVLRLAAPLAGTWMMLTLSLAGTAWCASFGLFAIFYGGPLARPRASGDGGGTI